MLGARNDTARHARDTALHAKDTALHANDLRGVQRRAGPKPVFMEKRQAPDEVLSIYLSSKTIIL
jgi:hypothetical protein